MASASVLVSALLIAAVCVGDAYMAQGGKILSLFGQHSELRLQRPCIGGKRIDYGSTMKRTNRCPSIISSVRMSQQKKTGSTEATVAEV